MGLFGSKLPNVVKLVPLSAVRGRRFRAGDAGFRANGAGKGDGKSSVGLVTGAFVVGIVDSLGGSVGGLGERGGERDVGDDGRLGSCFCVGGTGKRDGEMGVYGDDGDSASCRGGSGKRDGDGDSGVPAEVGVKGESALPDSLWTGRGFAVK